MLSRKVAELQRDKEAAKRYWEGLTTEQREAIGDALVLGEFDWREWMQSKPSRAFMDELDQLRMYWEQENS